MEPLHLRTTLGEIRKYVRKLPKRMADSSRLSKVFSANLAYQMFFRIHRAFMVKSDGRTDEYGDKWKPLSPATIAARPIGRGDVTRLGIGGTGEQALHRRTRGLLTPSQNAQWGAIFLATYNKLRAELGEKQAKIRAAEVAWGVLKAQGAQTKINTLSRRHVPIGIVTGEMETSLRPGRVMGPTYLPPKGQKFAVRYGRFTIGSNVPHTKYFNRDRPVVPKGRKFKQLQRQAIKAALPSVRQEIRKQLKDRYR